jgi:hypothetical protein
MFAPRTSRTIGVQLRLRTSWSKPNPPSNTPFTLKLPNNTFIDDGNDILTTNAASANNIALPSWLKFGPKTKFFCGTPLEPST